MYPVFCDKHNLLKSDKFKHSKIKIVLIVKKNFHQRFLPETKRMKCLKTILMQLKIDQNAVKYPIISLKYSRKINI